MKKLLIFTFLVSAAILSGCTKKNEVPANGAPANVDQSANQAANQAGADVASNTIPYLPEVAMRTIENDKFSMTVPVVWQERIATPSAPSVWIFQDTGQRTPPAEKINFLKSLVVSYRAVANKTFVPRGEESKSQFQKDYPGALFVGRSPAVNTRQGEQVFEGRASKDGVDYRFFIFIITGETIGDGTSVGTWEFSFTTLKDEASFDLSTFYQIVDSFRSK